MARSFPGGANTDNIQLAITTRPASRSCAFWYNRVADGGGGAGRIFAQSSDSLQTNGTGKLQLNADWSTDGIWQTTAAHLTAGVDVHCVVSYDGSNVNNDPVFYINGVSVAVTESTAPVGTRNTGTGTLYVGNLAAMNRCLDGILSEFAMYDRALTEAEAVAIFKGTPQNVPDYVIYMPLVREVIDYANAAPIVTGTSVATHPRIIRPNFVEDWSLPNPAPPAITDPGNQSANEGDAFNLDINATNPAGGSLTWALDASSDALPASLALNSGTGVISGTLGYEDAAVYDLVVKVTDYLGQADTTSFSLTVSNTNRAPVLTNPGTQNSAENDVINLQLSASDPDGNGITFSIQSGALPGGLSMNSAGLVTGTISYTTAASSPYSITVRATDNGSPNLYDEETFTWNVSNTNRAPVLTNPGTQNDSENEAINLQLSATDPDGNGMTFSIQSGSLPAGLSINSSGLVTGTIAYTAAASSPYSITIRVTDNGSPNLYDEETFTWNVANTNRAPVLNAISNRSHDEGDTITPFSASATDPDNDDISYSIEGQPSGITINEDTGQITGTIAGGAAASSPYTVIVTATDNGTPALEDTTEFTWTVDTDEPGDEDDNSTVNSSSFFFFGD